MGGDEQQAVAHVGHDRVPDWQMVDRALRACARRRAALDAHEARWLVEAERLAIHRAVGCGSIHEYLERILGYGPRVARDRLRIARALDESPAMAGALASGALAHSAVRELTRVVTPATEQAWIDAARGCCLREVEQLVGGRERGDLPDDPDDAPARPVILRLEVSPTAMALYRDATRRLEDQTGDALSDDQVVDLLCRGVLDARASDSMAHVGHAEDPKAHVGHAGDPTAHVGHAGDPVAHVGHAHGPVLAEDQVEVARANKPPYQIAVTVCDSCRRGWQDASGRPFVLPAASLARARCDAEILGRVDGAAPARVTRTIPPAVRRQVTRRDRGRCVVPGCRAARHLEVHHVVPRALGGTHDPLGLAA